MGKAQSMEEIVQHAINNSIEFMGQAKDRGEIDREIGRFSGFWNTIHRQYSNLFGEGEATKFQERVLIHHHKQTKDLTGNSAYAQSLRFHIGDDLTNDQYDLLIKKHEIEELERARREEERVLEQEKIEEKMKLFGQYD